MSFKNGTTPLNSPKILNFQTEKQPSQLSIYIDDTDNRLFYLKYYSLVKDRCLAILRNKEDAEDMAHDVFAHILEKFKTDEQFIVSHPKTFLSTVAANMSINKKKEQEGN